MILKKTFEMRGCSFKEIKLKSYNMKQDINEKSLNQIDLTVESIILYQVDLNKV
jgi:hypothetical protein